MKNFLGRILYRIIDLSSGLDIAERLRTLNETQFWDRDRLRELQQRKLRTILADAQRNVPLYEERYDFGDLDLSRTEPLEALGKLPVLTKAEVLDAGERILDRHPNERFQWDVTSGSSGAPMAFRRSLSANGWHRATQLRMLRWYGVRAGDRQARFWGASISWQARQQERLRDFVLNRRRFPAFDVADRLAPRAHLPLVPRSPRCVVNLFHRDTVRP